MREIGIPVELLIEYVGLYQQGDETIKERKELLFEQHKQFITKLAEMKKVLRRMDDKITSYEQTILEKEKN
jgi:DNA-binding transcriptional MerR regulator